MKNNRLTYTVLCSLLILSIAVVLCACGSNTAPSSAPASEAPAAQPSAAVEEVGSDRSTESNEGDNEIAGQLDVEDLASRFVDSPLDALLAELGEPSSREYVPSCLGPGEDGELFYDGFTVYTFKSADGEVVIDVDTNP